MNNVFIFPCVFVFCTNNRLRERYENNFMNPHKHILRKSKMVFSYKIRHNSFKTRAYKKIAAFTSFSSIYC